MMGGKFTYGEQSGKVIITEAIERQKENIIVYDYNPELSEDENRKIAYGAVTISCLKQALNLDNPNRSYKDIDKKVKADDLRNLLEEYIKLNPGNMIEG